MLLIDFGATYAKFAFLKDKKIRKVKTGEIIKTLEDIKKATKKYSGAVRCAFAGWIKDGVIIKAPNVKVENFNLAEAIKKVFETQDVKVENDANAQILGIMNFELKNKYKNAVLFTLGSGVGGGVFIDGRLYKGSAFAGEFGHIKTGGRKKCGCGGRGCVEAYIGLKRIIELANKKGLKVKDTVELAAYARAKNPVAIDVFNYYGRMLGIAVADVVNVLSPQVVIFGGGISKAKRFFFKALKESIDKNKLFDTDLYFSKNPEKYTLLGASIL